MSDEALPQGKTRELASVFDRLVDSNIDLTTSVGKLVRQTNSLIRLTHGVLVFNAVLVVLVIIILVWRHA